MKILMVVSEIDGIIKTGGLADFASALPKALAESGHDVKVVLPAYKNAVFPEIIKYESLYFNLNHSDYYGSLALFSTKTWKKSLDKKSSEQEFSFDIRLIEHHGFFSRNGIYGDYNSIAPYPDNALRYAFLCKAAIELCLVENWIPDIIHCNDWQTAILPYYLKEHYLYNLNYYEIFKNTKTVLTIHNGEYQGKTDKKWLDSIGILPERFTSGLIEEYGLINLLKCGIMYADGLNAVSYGYFKELLQPETSHQNLWIYLNKRKENFTGILNGCDYTLWNPETDSFLPCHFSAENIDGKSACKTALQNRMMLPVSTEKKDAAQSKDVPLFGLISRLTAQKGFDYLIPALERLLYEDHQIQIAILGSGDPDYGSRLHHLERRYRNKMSFVNGYDNELAHLIEAGADFFMMPSLFEPCGLNQLYSLAYGTVPIVRETGGLKDTITPLAFDLTNTDKADGIGFIYPDADSCYNALKRAVSLYYENISVFRAMQKNGMAKRFTWEQSAAEYVKLYQSLSR